MPGYTRHRSRDWARKNPERNLCWSAKSRAKRLGIPFDLTPEDIFIPDFCPVFGIKMQRSEKSVGHYLESPTLDRIVPELGYVRGNIAVISGKANLIKNFGTAEEHERIAAWLRAIKGSK